ncbi:MAG: putative deaminase [Thermoleophilia bacterium]|nr:putative deaminase [Thermoleophilia bacterium]
MNENRQNELVSAAINCAAKFNDPDGLGAAALLLDDGSIITSGSPPFMNAAVSVCYETGAILSAWNEQKRVVASVCVMERDGDMIVLAPCGICQEQLRLWGPDVQVAVTVGTVQWKFVTLGSLQPHWWGTVFEEHDVQQAGDRP